MATTYQYSPFPDTNSIRLIFLDEAANIDDCLRCHLKIISLDDDELPEFEAISYAWGDPILSHQLLIDGQRLDITLSLFSALQRMRLSTTVRVLWADAVCVNQSDISERSQQVQLMRKIYRGASRVLVWLGPSGPEVPVAMNLIEKMNAILDEEDAQNVEIKFETVSAELNAMWGLPTFDSPNWSSLVLLFSRSYFTRAWIVQEIRLSRSALAFCGEHEMVWNSLVKACCGLISKSYQLVLLEGSARATYQPATVGMTNDIKASIQNLLFCMSCHNATDPKDKVFSILGLVAEAIESKDTRLLPDYSKSTIQVYRDIIHYVIETHPDLDILSLASIPPDLGQTLMDETVNFPSWVARPDLGIQTVEFGKDVSRTSSNFPPFLLPSLDEDALILRGICFDSLASDRRQGLQSILDSEMFETMWNNIAHEAIAYSQGKDRLWALYVTLMGGRTVTSEYAANTASYLADVWAYEKELFEEAKMRRRTPSNRIELLGEELHASDQTGSATRFKAFVTRGYRDNVLFTTAKGYIGQGPPWMHDGDIICILFGGKVPYILRPEGSHWRFIGECYVHGIMQGEGLKDFNGDFSQTEIFEIR